jgi:hypothetical protein
LFSPELETHYVGRLYEPGRARREGTRIIAKKKQLSR